MKHPADIIEAVGLTRFASVVGVKLSTASEMRRRNSIPVGYWRPLIGARKELGLGDLSYERLVEMHTSKRAPAPTHAVAAASS